MTTLLDHLSLAHLRLCKARASLQVALDLAKRQRQHPVLLDSLHDSIVNTTALIRQLDPIVDTLSGAPPSDPT